MCFFPILPYIYGLFFVLYAHSNLTITGLASSMKKDAPVSVATDGGGVVGLNFHQSKDPLITDSLNGSSYTLNGNGPTTVTDGVAYDEMGEQTVVPSCWSDVSVLRRIY